MVFAFQEAIGNRRLEAGECGKESAEGESAGTSINVTSGTVTGAARVDKHRLSPETPAGLGTLRACSEQAGSALQSPEAPHLPPVTPHLVKCHHRALDEHPEVTHKHVRCNWEQLCFCVHKLQL